LNQSRVCTKCNQLKPLTEFHKATKELLGVMAQCKSCRKAYAAAYNLANQDQVNARNKTYAALNKERVRKISSDWQKLNPSRAKEAQARYRLRHKEELKARRKLRLEYNRNAWNKRKVQKASNGVFAISKPELAKLYAQPCFYCGAIGQIEMDHVIPIKRGGAHSIGNLVAACMPCNRSKGSKTITEWKKQKGADE